MRIAKHILIDLQTIRLRRMVPDRKTNRHIRACAPEAQHHLRWWMLPLIFLCLQVVQGQTGDDSAHPGFVDSDRNGINDRFCDADGDGVNDVTGEAYPHHFQFRDENGDGVNDLWTDADGDGVNDLLSRFGRSAWIDLDGDGILDSGSGQLRGKALRAHVLDMDGDGKNDITGAAVTDDDVQGYKYGQMNEEKGSLDRGFTDLDGDGMNDRNTGQGSGQGTGRMDHFVDQDGDGIADERGWGRLRSSGRNRK